MTRDPGSEMPSPLPPVDDARVAFLRTLSAAHDYFTVWKHVDRGIRGLGDIDAATTVLGARHVRETALRVARPLLGATTTILCDHVADKQLLFFVQPDLLPQLFELDLCLQPSSGLAPWASTCELVRHSVMRDDGVRALRPGAEAIVSIVYYGLRATDLGGIKSIENRIIRQGLDTDFDGALAAVGDLVPLPARAPITELIRRAANGGWSQPHARRARIGFLASSPAHPAHVTRRVAFRGRLALGRDCVMSRLARERARQVAPNGLDDLIRVAQAQGHTVV